MLGRVDLEDVAVRCAQLRADLGLSAGLRPADRLVDVLAAAVLDAGWPAAAAVRALLAVAADPATRSPARPSCAGPWWDAPIGCATGGNGSDDQTLAEVADLEVVLAETGGLRVLLQRQARADLEREHLPLTRASVTRRAVEILRRRTPDADLPATGRAAGESPSALPPSPPAALVSDKRMTSWSLH